MNRVILTGRITKDPEVRYTQAGIPSVSFVIAVDRGMKDAQGNRQADFINCVAWRGQADFISRFIKKGYMLCVEGRIQTRNYQNQTGQTVYVTEVVVDSLENLQPRDPNAQPQPGYQQPQGYAPNQPQYQQNPYQGYNNPSYGAPQAPQYQSPTPAPEAPQSFNVNVDDDDLPF